MEKEENKTTVDNEDIKKNLGDDKTDKSENNDLSKDDEKKRNHQKKRLLNSKIN